MYHLIWILLDKILHHTIIKKKKSYSDHIYIIATVNYIMVGIILGIPSANERRHH